MSDKNNLQAELSAICTQLRGEIENGRNLSSKMEELDTRYVQVKSALDAMEGVISGMQSQAPAAPQGRVRYQRAASLIADQACANQDLRDFMERKGNSHLAGANSMASMVTEFNSPFETKAAVGDANYGYQTTATRLNESRTILGVENEQQIDREDQRLLSIWDLITKRPASGPIIQWVEESSRTKDATGTSEGAEKSNSSFVLGNRVSQAVTIPTHLTVSRQLLEDVEEMREFIRDILMNAVEEHIEDQLLYGDGDANSGNLQGIMSHADLVTQSFLTNVYDTVRAGIRQLRKDNRAEANHLIVNHDDHYNMDTLKATDGHYLWVDSGRSALGGPVDQLWRVPIVPTNSILSGTGLLGNFNLGTSIRVVSPMQLLVSYENQDNFVRNMVTTLCETRLHFIIKRIRRFRKLGLLSGY